MAADGDTLDESKLTRFFIGGCQADKTPNEKMAEYFSQFGELAENPKILLDKVTGAPKRCAYMKFVNLADADKCYYAKPHKINDVKLDVRLAVKPEVRAELKDADFDKQKKPKIFIGGLHKDATEEEITKYFNEHWASLKVADFILKKNPDTKESRCFGFLTFEDSHQVAKVAHLQHFTIKGKKADCRVAQNQERSAGMGGGMMGPGGRGAGRGGRGGTRGGGGGGFRGGYGGGAGGGAGGYQDGYDNWGEGYGGSGGYYEEGYGDGQAGYDYSGYEGYGYGNEAGGDYMNGSGSYGQRGGRGGYGAGYNQGGYGGGSAERGGGRGRSYGYHPYRKY